MMPYDHAAAGFLVTFILVKIFHPDLSVQEYHSILLWSMFWGNIPDFDLMISWTLRKKGIDTSHRAYPTHAPLPWILLFLGIYFFSDTLTVKHFLFSIGGGVLSHLLVDTIEHGIMWLWPFNLKQFMLFTPPSGDPWESERGTWKYYFDMYKNVYMKMQSFKVGLAVVAVSFLIYFFCL